MELMIGFIVFSILALGITATAIHNLRSSQQNIMKNTAYSVSQGFAEQIKSIPESDLLASIAEPEVVPLPTRGIAATAHGSAVDVDSPLYLKDPNATADGENHRQILIDLREEPSGDISEVYMEMWFDVDVTRLKTSRGFLIQVDFKYKHPALSHLGTLTNTVRMVRTAGAEN